MPLRMQASLRGAKATLPFTQAQIPRDRKDLIPRPGRRLGFHQPVIHEDISTRTASLPLAYATRTASLPFTYATKTASLPFTYAISRLLHPQFQDADISAVKGEDTPRIPYEEIKCSIVGSS